MRSNRAGFTMIELIVVIAILAILAVIIISAVMGALSRAKKTASMANLRSCRIYLQQYNTKTGQTYDFPKRLTHVATRNGFTDEPGVFLDPNDAGHGKYGPFPPAWGSPADVVWFNADLGEGMNPAVTDEYPTSFIYEMADVNAGVNDPSRQSAMLGWLYNNPPPSKWDTNDDGKISWRECKTYQLRNGDNYSNSWGITHYPTALFPILRSGWWATFGYNNVDFELVDPNSSANTQNTIASVMCESMEGNYFETTIYWEPYVVRRMGKPVPLSDFVAH